jgi:DNA repair protein RadC
MKNTPRIHRNGDTKTIKSQAGKQTPFAPAEFKTVRLRDCPVDSPTFQTPMEVADFWHRHVVSAPWFRDDKECLCVFMLDTRKRLLGFELASQGTSDTILINPREVLRPAVVHNAAAIIIAHNHPSGDPTPSKDDIRVTRDLMRAAQQLKIELCDHIIIGDTRREDSFSSLNDMGYFGSADPIPLPVSAPGSVAVPNKIALGVEDSLVLLERAGAAAVALCVMNGYTIGNAVKDGLNGMGKLGSETFADGIVVLAETLEYNFASGMAVWREDQQGMIKGREHSHEVWIQMSRAVGALKHTLGMQGGILMNHSFGDEATCGQHISTCDDPDFEGAVDCGFITIKELKSAWKEAENLSRKAQCIFLEHKSKAA